ncbi:MAG TPA: CvpA family protein [Hyphomicrobiales bacterium]|nr:CvpA family protein [Hyphomicrobiales bacterium]
MPIQGLDIILIVIMIFSGFLAMLRGLTREMLSIMSWALAALVTLLVYSNFRWEFRRIIDTPMLADGTLILVTFIGSLIIFSLITANISERVLDSRVGAIDRTLGFIYGLVRGLILVVIAYLIIGQIVDIRNMPRWVTEARSLPLIESAGDTIKSFLPDNPESLFKRDRPASPADRG